MPRVIALCLMVASGYALARIVLARNDWGASIGISLFAFGVLKPVAYFVAALSGALALAGSICLLFLRRIAITLLSGAVICGYAEWIIAVVIPHGLWIWRDFEFGRFAFSDAYLAAILAITLFTGYYLARIAINNLNNILT